MRAITISREMGSLGREVARRTAECAGFRLLWREVLNEAARRAGAGETALAEIDELGLLNLRPSPAAIRKYRKAVEQVMREAVEAGGVVILGRAGQVVLHDVPDVLHVRIIAPLSVRVERIADRLQISIEAARAQVEASDRHRRDYLKHYYRAHWDDPEMYDLTINTENLGVEPATEIICRAAAIPAGAPPLSPHESRRD